MLYCCAVICPLGVQQQRRQLGTRTMPCSQLFTTSHEPLCGHFSGYYAAVRLFCAWMYQPEVGAKILYSFNIEKNTNRSFLLLDSQHLASAVFTWNASFAQQGTH